MRGEKKKRKYLTMFCSRLCSYSSSRKKASSFSVLIFFLFSCFFFFFRSRLLFSILSILIASNDTINPTPNHVSFCPLFLLFLCCENEHEKMKLCIFYWLQVTDAAHLTLLLTPSSSTTTSIIIARNKKQKTTTFCLQVHESTLIRIYTPIAVLSKRLEGDAALLWVLLVTAVHKW